MKTDIISLLFPQFFARNFLHAILAAALSISFGEAAGDRPNVVFVITDDQGYGDLGFTGNPIIQTPNIDQLARESTWLEDFHVAPSCSPTRSSLLTGRWTNRTGVWHTFFARAMMYEDEVTLADLLQSAGYATGMFGKWHLGDRYPYRPQDRGFDEVYCIKGGAIGITSDYWNNDYFDDHYYQNEEVVQAKGYCTDVFFAEASRFIRERVAAKKTFFAYISTNAPHVPWICPPEYMERYSDIPDRLKMFYGMITNIDENVGRLRSLLERLGVAENTIFIFTTDNGSVGPNKVANAYNAGMRGGKISPYEGGHRVPFALHWPAGGYCEHASVKQLTHMVDILPTLLDLCGIDAPQQLALDGRSIRKLLRGDGDDSFDWENRYLISDSQRVQTPVKWKGSCVMSGKWRLVKGMELYNIRQDPGQRVDLASEYPERLAAMRGWYEKWWKELMPGFSRTSEIYIGGENSKKVNITALQWIDADPIWNQGMIRKGALPRASNSESAIPFKGHWAVNVERDGFYEFEVRRWPEESGLKICEGIEAHSPELKSSPSFSSVKGEALPVLAATLRIDGVDLETKRVSPEDLSVRFTHKLVNGSHKFSPYFAVGLPGGEEKSIEMGCYYLTVKRMDGSAYEN